MAPSDPTKKLDEFISHDRTATYTFDSERGAPLSELCRERDGRKCIILEMYATKLFQEMQARGFYCALPMDPARTHMECKPQAIPKSSS